MITSTPCCFVAVVLACLLSSSEAGQLANGFVMDRIGDVTGTATCLTFITGDRALTCTKSGSIEIFKLPKQGETLIKEVYMKPAYNQIDAKYERGLLDLVPHPDFANNGLLYMYYCGRDTFHVAQLRHQENQGGSSSRTTWFSQKIIWSDPDGIMGKFHYGGSLSFGPDMNIYLSQGDKSFPQKVQDKESAAGCIHRFRTDGSIPKDNMGVLDGKKNRPDSVWAVGIRNGWRAHWDIIYGQYYIAEVGGNEQASATEDLHLGKAGANYGWPMCEVRLHSAQENGPPRPALILPLHLPPTPTPSLPHYLLRSPTPSLPHPPPGPTYPLPPFSFALFLVHTFLTFFSFFFPFLL